MSDLGDGEERRHLPRGLVTPEFGWATSPGSVTGIGGAIFTVTHPAGNVKYSISPGGSRSIFTASMSSGRISNRIQDFFPFGMSFSSFQARFAGQRIPQNSSFGAIRRRRPGMQNSAFAFASGGGQAHRGAAARHRRWVAGSPGDLAGKLKHAPPGRGGCCGHKALRFSEIYLASDTNVP